MIDIRHESKTKFLDAALHVFCAKGYSATRVEDVCDAAQLTKGSFFHHFDTKEDLALASAEYWGAMTSALFEAASYRAISDPRGRLLAYVDFRKAILQGELPEFTCLVGTMVQEVCDTHPAIRVACDKSISEHVATLQPDIAEMYAPVQRGRELDRPESRALHPGGHSRRVHPGQSQGRLRSRRRLH
jgi:TetR/AcrR family transcriptional regulator, transcriptional repressor for nem operon